MNKIERERRVHLGDGLYIHYTGYSYELSVNNHMNYAVATFEAEHIDKFKEFKDRMEAQNDLE